MWSVSVMPALEVERKQRARCAKGENGDARDGVDGHFRRVDFTPPQQCSMLNLSSKHVLTCVKNCAHLLG